MTKLTENELFEQWKLKQKSKDIQLFEAWQARAELADIEKSILQAEINELRKALNDITTADEMGVCDSGYTAIYIARKALAKIPPQCLQEHDNEVIEMCAKICEKEYLQYKNTENAHYRLSPAPFIADNFGFNMEIIKKSKYDSEKIRALKGKQNAI